MDLCREGFGDAPETRFPLPWEKGQGMGDQPTRTWYNVPNKIIMAGLSGSGVLLSYLMEIR